MEEIVNIQPIAPMNRPLEFYFNVLERVQDAVMDALS